MSLHSNLACVPTLSAISNWLPQIGSEYLDPELFLLQRESTSYATVWQPGNDFAGGLYYQEHWPVNYIDSTEVAKVNSR